MKPGWGKRHEPGVRNKLEAEYDTILAAREDVAWYGFERIKWKLADNTYYVPDYFVQLTDGELQVHEVKGGFFPAKNKLKLKVVAEQMPMRVILCQYKNKATGWIFTEI